MTEIKLDKNLITWVDDDDADFARLGLRAKPTGKGHLTSYYAVYTYDVYGSTTEKYLQDLVWERKEGRPVPKGFLVDHINMDKLDNRRDNLRLATKAQNEANKRKRRSKTSSRYKGVSKIVRKKATHQQTKPWRATITIEKKNVALGCYATEEEAARAYDKAAIDHYGVYARVNFPEEIGHEQSD